MNYTFKMYESIKACRKSTVLIEADSQEEALKKVINGEIDDFLDSWILEETEEGDPDGIRDIYDETGNELLYTTAS